MELYLFRHEQQTGPYTEADARALVVAGEIERTCPAWQEGMAEWLPLDQVLNLGGRPTPPPALGLPPVPAASQTKVPSVNIPKSTKPTTTPAEPKWFSFLNVYGWGIGIGIVTLLRVLVACHRH